MKQNTLLYGDIKKELIVLALPLLAGNILQQFYNTIDAFIVGRYLGTSAFAAIGISSTIMNMFIFVLNGFCVGVSMLLSRFYGMNDIRKFHRQFGLSLTVGIGITAILSITSVLLLRPLLRVMKTPQNIYPFAVTYLTIILIGLFATCLYNLLSNALRAIGDTNASLLFLMISILLNTVLDVLLIAGFHMGIAGSAYATVIAQLFSAACCYLYMKKKYPSYICQKEDLGLHTDLLKQTLSFGIVSALHQSSLYIGKLLVQGAVNSLGTPGIVSYTATMRVEGIVNAFSDSGSQAMSVLIAQNYGAGKKNRVHDSFLHGLFFMIITSIIFSTFLFATSSHCMTFLIGSSTQNLIQPGISYLKIVSVFYLLCYIGSAFVAFFRGVGKVNVPFIATSIHITVRVVLSYLLVNKMGLSAVALATGIGWICAVCIHFRIYHKSASQYF